MLLIALIEIYVLRNFPYGFGDWIVNLQTRVEFWRLAAHSRLFYLARFAFLTALIEALGVTAFLYLKGRRARV